MAYVKLKSDNTREYLESAPKYFFDGGIPVSDEWLIVNENIYPVVDQDLSSETDVIELIEQPIEDWTLNETNITRTYKVVKDDEIPNYDAFYQHPVLNNQSEWVTDGIYILRTYTILTTSIDDMKSELKIRLKDKRKVIETGGFKYNYIESEQGTYYLIASDLESQSKLSIYAITVDNYESIKWKSFNQFITFTPDEIKALNLSLNDFVKRCFDNEERISNLIDDATDYTELKEVYLVQFEEGWSNESSIYLTGV